MFYSLLAPVLGVALTGGFVDASPTPFNLNAVAVADSYAPAAALAGDLEARALKPCIFELGKSWDDEVLFKGSVGASIEVDLSLPKAAISGEIQVQVTDKFLAEPTVRVDLGGVKAYFEVHLAASVGVFESVELLASSRLDLDVPGLAKVDIGAAFALDLVIGVSAAVDVSAGFYVTFPEGCYVEISLLTKEIVRHKLNGLIAQSLPISVGAGVDVTTAIDLFIGLRLRACIGIGAGVGLLGLDIGAGADVAIWVNLFSYTTKIVQTSTCPCAATETFALSAGVAVELDVKVGQVIDLSLAPTVMVTLSTAELAMVCLPSLPGGGYGQGCDGEVCPAKSLPGSNKDSGNGKGSLSSQLSSGLPVSSSPAMSKDTAIYQATVSPDSSLSSSITALPTAAAGSSSGSSPHSGAGASASSAYPSGSGHFPGSDLPSVSVPGSGAGSGLPSASTVHAASLVLSSGSESGLGSAYPSQTGGNGPITTDTADGSMITSTITTTQTYTITSCAVSVPNCPASHTQKIVTSTVITTTTVCPANEATMTLATMVTKPTREVPAPPTQVTTVTLTTCPVPHTSTFQPPADYPTLQPTVTVTGCGGNGNGEECGQGPSPSKSNTAGMVKPSGPSGGSPVHPSGGYPTGGHPTGGKPAGVYPTGSSVPTKGTAAATENLPVKPTVSPSPPVATAGASGRFLRGSGVAALGAVAAAMLL